MPFKNRHNNALLLLGACYAHIMPVTDALVGEVKNEHHPGC